MQRDMSPLIAAGAIAIPTSAQQAAQLGEHRPVEDRLEERAADVQGQERQPTARIRALPGDELHCSTELAAGAVSCWRGTRKQ